MNVTNLLNMQITAGVPKRDTTELAELFSPRKHNNEHIKWKNVECSKVFGNGCASHNGKLNKTPISITGDHFVLKNAF